MSRESPEHFNLLMGSFLKDNWKSKKPHWWWWHFIDSINVEIERRYYHCRKWNWWPEFTSLMILIAFHFALVSLGKLWNHLFLPLPIGRWYGRLVSLALVYNQDIRKRNEFHSIVPRLKIDLMSHPTHDRSIGEIPHPDFSLSVHM